MSDKFFVGLDLTGVEDNGLQRPISRVTLLLDDESSITAGDDTGAELLADCPHATQAMANAILAQVKGYQYHMFDADDAALDPAAELGDGVTAGGIYSVISRLDDDGSGYSGIAAPGESELEDEYPASGPMTIDFNRKIAQTRSQIVKTAERITLLVQNEVDGLEGKLELTATSLTSEITNTRDGLNSKIEQTAASLTTQISDTQSGLNSKIEQTAASIQTQISGLNNAYTSIGQTVDSISLGVFNGQESSTISLYKNGIAVQSQEISFSGMVTFSDLSGNSGTIIDGGAIDTNTLRLNSLYGNYIYINDSYGQEAGLISATGSSSYAGQKMKISSGAIEITATPGDLYLSGGGAYNATLQLGSGHAAIGGDCIPNATGRYSCGSSGFRWSDVYADNDTIQTSDREKKEDISDSLEAYGAFFDALRPVRYRLKDGTSGRTHLGLIAQDVEAALAACGLTGMDFAGFVKSPRTDGGYDYALRYGEFIALCISRIQRLDAQVAELERRLSQ